jgi:aldose 1-epimerase
MVDPRVDVVTSDGTIIERGRHGTLAGRDVGLYTLALPGGLEATISELGATIVSLVVPDRDGDRTDVVLGFDRLESYAAPGHYLGCVVGRVANRIAHGRFTLDGREHTLTINHGRHHLHGGAGGFSRAIWRAEPASAGSSPGLRLRYQSSNGEDGYPGALEAIVVYTLMAPDRERSLGELRMDFTATTDRATIVNLSQHSYWNLAGPDAGTVLDHHLAIAASRYTPADAELIPTGEIVPVAGTVFDFTRPRRIDDAAGGNYDVNFVLDGTAGALRRAATLAHPGSGRSMEVWTTEPGLQLYTGGNLAATGGKGGATYGRHAGLCLETQYFPDSIHHKGEPGWPSIILRPGRAYRHSSVHRFAVD